jgi:hypothetical protein
MSIGFLTSISNALYGITGSYILLGTLIILFFLIVFLIIGLEFRYSIMLIAPMIIAMAFGGWFGPTLWVSVTTWLLIVGLGLFLVYKAYEGY